MQLKSNSNKEISKFSLFQGDCKFVFGSSDYFKLPNSNLPEVAFFGRSNVGKSSLINSITGRQSLARISKTPGRTKQLNFFLLSDKLHLVDLPGYGYARVSKKEKENWFNLTRKYLEKRKNLSTVLVLIDSRRGIMEVDEIIMKFLDSCAISWSLVLTKIDKLSLLQIKMLLDETSKKIEKNVAAFPNIWKTSSKNKNGIVELREHLAKFIF